MSWYAAAIAAGGAIANTAINVNRQNAYQRRSEHLSREMANNSIQYKVQDAIKAGIHPLYAIGAPTINSPSFSFMPTDNLSQGASQIANMVYDKESKDLNNDLLKQQIESVKLQNAQRQLEISAMSSKPTTAPIVQKDAFQTALKTQPLAGFDDKITNTFSFSPQSDGTLSIQPSENINVDDLGAFGSYPEFYQGKWLVNSDFADSIENYANKHYPLKGDQRWVLDWSPTRGVFLKKHSISGYGRFFGELDSKIRKYTGYHKIIDRFDRGKEKIKSFFFGR